MKTCNGCFKELPLDSFYKKKGAVRGKCKTCWSAETLAWFANNREKRRGYHLNDKYGMSLDDYAKLSDLQDGKCGICHKTPKRLFVDHDHTTGVVRGLLCSDCNTGLGMFKDNLNNVQNAAIYLKG